MLLFWRAFVLTRPFGATLGDLLTKPFPQGGFGFDMGGSSAILITALVGLIAYSGWTLRRQLRPTGEMAE